MACSANPKSRRTEPLLAMLPGERLPLVVRRSLIALLQHKKRLTLIPQAA